METGLLHLHSVLRYLIIIIAIIAIYKMYTGKKTGRPFGKSDKMFALFYMIIMDIQLLIGLVLYFAVPGSMLKMIQGVSFGEIMGDKFMRFFVVEHLLGMLVAFVLIHIGYATTKKDIASRKKFGKAFTLFLIAFILILASVPWPFREALGRGWVPGM